MEKKPAVAPSCFSYAKEKRDVAEGARLKAPPRGRFEASGWTAKLAVRTGQEAAWPRFDLRATRPASTSTE